MQYALYVTPGQGYFDPNYAWGGYHITMSGFHPSNGDAAHKNAVKLISQQSLQNKIQWKPSDIDIEQWKGKWTLVVNSQTLKKLSDILTQHGFQKVKSPRFHITLPHAKNKKEAERVANQLLNKEKWFLTLVTKTPINANKNYYNWIDYKTLGKI